MFFLLEAVKGAAQTGAAQTPAVQPAGGAAGGSDPMGALMGGGMGAAFSGGTAKDKQMQGIANWFTDTMHGMFGDPAAAAKASAAKKAVAPRTKA